MPQKKKYISILRIELEDLQTDIENLMKELERRKESRECTDHVFLHNLTLFKNELLGVNTFSRILDSLNPQDYNNVDEMIEDISQRFQKIVKAHDFAPAIGILIQRKLDKVARYVKHTEK